MDKDYIGIYTENEDCIITYIIKATSRTDASTKFRATLVKHDVIKNAEYRANIRVLALSDLMVIE